MIKYKEVLIETSDFYIKQSIRNHSIILGPNGDQKITVPINRKNKTKTIFKDLKIAIIHGKNYILKVLKLHMLIVHFIYIIMKNYLK